MNAPVNKSTTAHNNTLVWKLNTGAKRRVFGVSDCTLDTHTHTMGVGDIIATKVTSKWKAKAGDKQCNIHLYPHPMCLCA